jgi:glycosyltransferase involved in cell wall biosynthesis
MRNEEKYITGCLESIFAQDYPSEKLEVIILDGVSSDTSWKLVEELIENKQNYYLLPNPKRTQSSGWNLGIKQAKGELITIVSAHSVLDSDYVSTAVETYFRTKADMVGGLMRATGESKIAETIACATSSPFGMGGARFHYTNKEEYVDTVYMGFCSKQLLDSIGGFDEELIRNQDDELSYRILDNGGTILCNPAIKSHYFNRASIRSLFKQYFEYGLWKIRVLQKHPKQMRLRQFIPPIFVLAFLLAFSLTFFFSWGWIALMSLAVLYLLATLIASMLTVINNGRDNLYLLPVVFTTLHFSYGLGFLVGLLKFWDRWGDKAGKTPQLSSVN